MACWSAVWITTVAILLVKRHMWINKVVTQIGIHFHWLLSYANITIQYDLHCHTQNEFNVTSLANCRPSPQSFYIHMSLAPCDSYMRRQTGSSLVEIKACRRLGAKRLQIYCWLNKSLWHFSQHAIFYFEVNVWKSDMEMAVNPADIYGNLLITPPLMCCL